MVWFYFFKDQFDIFSFPTTLDESWDWQFRDLHIDLCELGSLTKHFALINYIDAPIGVLGRKGKVKYVVSGSLLRWQVGFIMREKSRTFMQPFIKFMFNSALPWRSPDQQVCPIHWLFNSHQLSFCSKYFCKRGVYSCGIAFNWDAFYVIF